ncbi:MULTISPECIES: OsmC family protein [unclassified Cupriavidus]|uniref:OsmC family protein n=1 Tax=Cupriavidus TaxID=106589 RepID=UPI00226DF4A1|nr:MULTISPECIES: OsmC family protein [unclassified Cupriavidus]MCY0854514.1 OsmC family protein [Cupriavidus sp. D39]MDW3688717.1 OsmC family protein [Cupriavidus sp. CV2]
MHSAQAIATIEANAPNYLVSLQVDNHVLTGDEPAKLGGADRGPEPFAFVLCGLVSCTAATLKMYAERKKWDLGQIRVFATFEQLGHVRFILREVSVDGKLGEAERAQLAELCERTPVTLFLKGTTSIETILQ